METVARYGEIDKDGGAVKLPVYLPKKALSQVGGLQLSTQTTILGELTDAIEYLESYPFECSEQLASRFIAAASIRSVQDGLAGKASKSGQKKTRQMGLHMLRTLQGRQRNSGGVGFWDSDSQASPLISVHALHAVLLDDELANGDVGSEFVRKLKYYVSRISSWFSSMFDPAVNDVVKAYSLYVRSKYEPNMVVNEADELFRKYFADDKASQRLDIMSWCLMAMPKPREILVRRFVGFFLAFCEMRYSDE
jgi:uncharacterized protein YfaS (alpha-2-macroglobulin family)